MANTVDNFPDLPEVHIDAALQQVVIARFGVPFHSGTPPG